MRRELGLLFVGVLATWPSSSTSTRILELEDFTGWSDEDHREGLDVFLSTCDDLPDADWTSQCRVGADADDPHRSLEICLAPALIDDGRETPFTGHYETDLTNTHGRSDTSSYPLYALPKKAGEKPLPTRAEIEPVRCFITGALRSSGNRTASVLATERRSALVTPARAGTNTAPLAGQSSGGALSTNVQRVSSSFVTGLAKVERGEAR